MVKKIKLTQHQIAEVSDTDFEWLNQFKWQAHYSPIIKSYYAIRTDYLGKSNGEYKTKTIQMHRAIIERILEEKGQMEYLRKFKENSRRYLVDHKDHNTLKNTRANLRIVSMRQNMQNQRRKSISGYRGVTWHKQRNKWVVFIRIYGKKKNLGLFPDPVSGAIIYEFVNREVNGEELVCKT